MRANYLRFCCLIVVLYLLAACAAAPTSLELPKLEEIVQMGRDKVAPEEIIAVMRETHAVYFLSGSELVRLHEQGVPDAVIDEIQRAQIEATRDQEWQRATSRKVYWYDPYGGWMQQPGSIPSEPAPGWWQHR
jgi:hypothetical protein